MLTVEPADEPSPGRATSQHGRHRRAGQISWAMATMVILFSGVITLVIIVIGLA
ncbi:hypothetical protein LWC34_55160 [Kibdelosporangium philippinense]|uniref:Uncharacterized protein n=1 Tax=Kibdelosporangium philippinense TaxID=211113 RepID=A0ABS8ZW12_9PSEU|nr:hypothetical protein [Kibdelosporangium philippinense]MCE7011896.1 hypothetical protein [Kibdelosporangium philippinense]